MKGSERLLPKPATTDRARRQSFGEEQVSLEEETHTPMKTLAVVALKRGVILYWSLWFTVVLATNVVHGLKALGIIREGWTLSFGDTRLLSSSVWIYGAPAGLHGFTLAGVVAAEALIAVLFWRAFSKFHGLKNADRLSLAAAFILTVALFAAFLVADEISSSYLYEGTHLRIFIIQLASLLAVYLLPE